MSRTRRSARQSGTRWESAIVAYLRAYGWPHVERRARTGAKDQGDIAGLPGVVIEAKNCARIELARFLDEAQIERDHAGAQLGVSWVKRRGVASPGGGYVVMDGATFAYLLREAGW